MSQKPKGQRSTPAPKTTANTPVDVEPTVEPIVAPVEPEVEPVAEPVVEPTVVEPITDTVVVVAAEPEVVTPAVETVYTYLAARHPQVTALSPTVLSIITRLEQYVAAMGPTTPINADNGSINQRNLYTILQNAIGATGGEHRIAMDAVLYIIHRNRDGAFSDRLVMRFMEVTRLTRDAALAFQSLLHLFTTTCNPATRRNALRTIDMRRIVDKLGTVQYQQNLLDFYR